MRIVLIIISILIVNICFAQDIAQLNKKSRSAYEQGDYKMSKEFSKQAITLVGGKVRKNRTDYIAALNNLAYAEMALGRYKEAIRGFKFILSIYKEKDHKSIEYIEAVANVAKVYNAVSKSDSVEIYYNLGMKLFEGESQANSRYYRKNIISYFTALVELKAIYASLLSNKGETENAISQLIPFVSVIQSTFPENYQSLNFYFTIVNNIGNYYLELEDVENASKYVFEYNSIINEQSNPAEYLQSLTNLGAIYSKKENPDSAIYFWQKALAWGNSNHLETLTSYKSVLVNLGSELAHLEKYDSAISYLEYALTIQNTHSGYDAYLYKNTLYNLAVAHNWSGNYVKASEVWRTLLEKLKEEIQYNFSFLIEAEKRKFFQLQQFYFENFANYCLEASGIIPALQYSDSVYTGMDLASDLYNNRIMTKGVILNATEKMRQRILEGEDEEIRAKFLEWIENRYQLITLMAKSKPDLEEINQLQVKIDKMELELSRNSDPFREGFVFSEISWKDIQKKLRPGEVAIETVRFLEGLGYLALIVTSETVDRPHLTLVLSSKGKFLEKERMSFYNNSIQYQLKDTLSYQVYFAPIIKEAINFLPEGTKLEKIYFSPDGIYHQINLNTLFNVHTNKYLIEELDISILESTKYLATDQRNSSKKDEKTAFLLGNPTYTLDPQSATNYFVSLPGSEAEVKIISKQLEDKYWKVEMNLGNDATTSSIKDMQSPTILHIATHGFFFPLDTTYTNHSMLSLLLNSGLALAGINQNDNDIREAGILRAYEATNLNLDNTELVILSACETGLGNYYPGEGVYGLQKAFFTAGAEHIIMSLWKVDDTATQLLMTYFYNFYLQSKDIPSAFKMAQIELKKKYPHPKHWGAFVLLKG